MTEDPEDRLKTDPDTEPEPDAAPEEAETAGVSLHAPDALDDGPPDAEIEEAPPDLAGAPLPPGQAYDLLALETEGLDVDQALAAVASLNEIVMAPAAPEGTASGMAADEDSAADSSRRMPTYQVVSDFPTPPLMTLRRGQLASVVPALLLMVIGAWLTFALTTTEAAPNNAMILALLMGGVGVALLAQWVGSGQWSRGALLFGLLLLISAGVFFWLSQGATPGLARGWPLLICGLGAAFILSGLLSAIRERRQMLVGLMLVVSGLAGYAVTASLVEGSLLALARSAGPAVIAAMLLLIGLPAVLRGRR